MINQTTGRAKEVKSELSVRSSTSCICTRQDGPPIVTKNSRIRISTREDCYALKKQKILGNVQNRMNLIHGVPDESRLPHQSWTAFSNSFDKISSASWDLQNIWTRKSSQLKVTETFELWPKVLILAATASVSISFHPNHFLIPKKGRRKIFPFTVRLNVGVINPYCQTDRKRRCFLEVSLEVVLFAIFSFAWKLVL